MIRYNSIYDADVATILKQSANKISLELPLVVLGLNTEQKNHFKKKLKRRRLKITKEHNGFWIVEKILKERNIEENLITFTARDDWFLDDSYLNSSDQKLLRFEVGMYDLQAEIEAILMINEQIEKKENFNEECVVLAFRRT